MFRESGKGNQSEIHYAMPVRIMGYDFSEYKKQLMDIQKMHREKKDLSGAEFLSGFSKDDRLKAIVTLVLYYGEEPWTGPRCLKDILDMQDIPEELKAMVVDYPIHIVDVRRFKDSEKLQTDARIVFGLLQRVKDGDAMEQYANENQAEVQQLSTEACDLLTAITGSKDFLRMKEENVKEKGRVDMCEVFRQLEEKYKKRGLEAGLAEGRAEEREHGIKNLIESFKELEIEKERVLSKLQDKYLLSEEEAEEYMKMYWK